MILTAFHGFCMALADSVPGVSGGTIAFILGFYDRFLDSLHALFGKDRTARKDALCYLAKLGTGWSIGMIACVLVLSGLIEKNIYFMSFSFSGTDPCLTAIYYLGRASGTEKPSCYSLCVVGSGSRGRAYPTAKRYLCAGKRPFFLTLATFASLYFPFRHGSDHRYGAAWNFRLLLLLIAGVYLPTVQAIKAFLSLDFSVVPGLCALGFGVIAGVGLSVHGIRTALRKYRSQMVWLILGLMLGSTYAIANGPASLSSPLPPLDITSFHVPAFLLGVAILLGLEFSKKFMQQNEKPSPAAQKGESLS